MILSIAFAYVHACFASLHPDNSNQVLLWQAYLPVSSRGRTPNVTRGEEMLKCWNKQCTPAGIEPGVSSFKFKHSTEWAKDKFLNVVLVVVLISKSLKNSRVGCKTPQKQTNKQTTTIKVNWP